MRFLAGTDPRYKVWEQCESEIEQLLCCAIFALLGCRAVTGPLDWSELRELAGDAPACFLFSQHWIGRYRADFMTVTVDPKHDQSRRLVIECDGKRSHGSPEQIVRDDGRDKAIRQSGYQVIRYSGRALYGEMQSVLADLREWIERAGVICQPPEDLKWYASMISGLMKDITSGRDRRQAREADRDEDEVDSETYFVGHDGGRYKWSDTI
jgi:very-short-patch-repair endonuclease